MLYFSILVVTCISFYPSLDRCIASTQDLHWQVDNSLVALMIDTLLGAEDSETDTPNGNDNDVSSFDFLSTRMSWFFTNTGSVQSKKVPFNKSVPDSPALKKFTPPPKV